MIVSKKTFFLSICCSLAIGFFIALALSNASNRFYATDIRLSLISSHEALGIINFKKEDWDEALFHFKNALFMTEEPAEELFKKYGQNRSFFFPIKGAVGEYLWDFVGLDEYKYKYTKGQIQGFYGYTLDMVGNHEAALLAYTQSADTLDFEDAEKAKLHTKVVMENYIPLGIVPASMKSDLIDYQNNIQ